MCFVSMLMRQSMLCLLHGQKIFLHGQKIFCPYLELRGAVPMPSFCSAATVSRTLADCWVRMFS